MFAKKIGLFLIVFVFASLSSMSAMARNIPVEQEKWEIRIIDKTTMFCDHTDSNAECVDLAKDRALEAITFAALGNWSSLEIPTSSCRSNRNATGAKHFFSVNGAPIRSQKSLDISAFSSLKCISKRCKLSCELKIDDALKLTPNAGTWSGAIVGEHIEFNFKPNGSGVPLKAVLRESERTEAFNSALEADRVFNDVRDLARRLGQTHILVPENTKNAAARMTLALGDLQECRPFIKAKVGSVSSNSTEGVEAEIFPASGSKRYFVDFPSSSNPKNGETSLVSLSFISPVKISLVPPDSQKAVGTSFNTSKWARLGDPINLKGVAAHNYLSFYDAVAKTGKGVLTTVRNPFRHRFRHLAMGKRSAGVIAAWPSHYDWAKEIRLDRVCTKNQWTFGLIKESSGSAKPQKAFCGCKAQQMPNCFDEKHEPIEEGKLQLAVIESYGNAFSPRVKTSRQIIRNAARPWLSANRGGTLFYSFPGEE